jgi:two-component system nitrogen regulation response regulator GlnG
VERVLPTRTLRQIHGHQAQASDLLGLNQTTLRNKLRELGLSLDKIVTEEARHPVAGEETM